MEKYMQSIYIYSFFALNQNMSESDRVNIFTLNYIIMYEYTLMDDISYTNSGQAQPYQTSLTTKQSSLLVALKTNTVRCIRSAFGDMYTNKQCPLQGCSEPD